MMRRVAIIGALAAMAATSCHRAPQPFAYALTGDTSGFGFVMVDKLSVDRKVGIVILVDLLPQKGSGFDTKYLNRLREQGSLHLALQVGSFAPATSAHLYEFTNAVSDFTWYHGNFMAEVAQQWDAESGDIAVDLRCTTPSNRFFTATVSVSNLVFKSTGGRQRRRIDRLTIPDVRVGRGRE